MKYIYVLLFLVYAEGFAQEKIQKKNQVFLNGGNETLFVGVSYRRSVWLPKPDSSRKNNNHFEVGGGVGWSPILFQPSETLPFSFSHSMSYVIEKKRLSFVLNYSGIIVPRDRVFRSRFLYTPNPSVGIRFQLFRENNIFIGINFNAYFYTQQTFRIMNDDDLFRKKESKVALFPGLSLGFLF